METTDASVERIVYWSAHQSLRRVVVLVLITCFHLYAPPTNLTASLPGSGHSTSATWATSTSMVWMTSGDSSSLVPACWAST